jgi:hypothetical protein
MAGTDGQRLVIKGTDRAHYALGILGLESDYENLEIDDDE